MGKEDLKDECKRKHLRVGGKRNELQLRLEMATFGQRTIPGGKEGAVSTRPREGGGGEGKKGKGNEWEKGVKVAGWEAMGSMTGVGEAQTGGAQGSLGKEEERLKSLKSFKAELQSSSYGKVEDSQSD